MNVLFELIEETCTVHEKVKMQSTPSTADSMQTQAILASAFVCSACMQGGQVSDYSVEKISIASPALVNL